MSRIFSNNIGAIARNIFREAIHDRIFYDLILFVLLITASAIFLGELTAGQESRVIVNLGLSSMLLFGAFIAVFVGVGILQLCVPAFAVRRFVNCAFDRAFHCAMLFCYGTNCYRHSDQC